jgi:N-acetylmuramoyl-L-alanine amidase
MRVVDHWLETEPADSVQLQRLLESDRGGPIVPEAIIVHYSVTANLQGTVQALKARDYVSCHLAIDGYREGERSVLQCAQMVPFNRRAYHAGESSWNGRPALNGWAIGIEVSNPGPLLLRNGQLFTTWGSRWVGDSVAATHASGLAPHEWNHWAPFTDEEIELLIQLCATLRAAYPTIREVLGHDQVAPGRKFDPGPCVNLDVIREAVFPDAVAPTVRTGSQELKAVKV